MKIFTVFSIYMMFTAQLLLCAPTPPLTSHHKKEIGMLIWANECSKSYERLAFWKTNEKFPSLGICHCIWYPTKNADHYVQTFPDLITFFKKKNVPLPEWLIKAHYAPWKTKEEFDAAAQSKEVQELRKLMYETMDLQVEFLIERFQLAVPCMLKKTSPAKQNIVQQNIDALLQTPQGTFALLDYLNFKGDGTDEKERYNGAGWGLLQVLEGMDMQTNGNVIVRNFVSSACKVLTNRIANAPTHKTHEKEWLKGWINRVNRYTEQKFS